MVFEQIRVGGDRNFAYLVGDEASGDAAVVDPSFDPEAVFVRAETLGLRIRLVVNTHGHGDHTNGNAFMVKRCGAKIVAHTCSAVSADIGVRDGDVVRVGGLEMKVLHTPGHTEDSICLLVENKLLTGDTLFVGKVGGTDFGDGARKEFRSLREKILRLDDDVEVWPAHDYGVAPNSTIGREKRTNPFLLRDDFGAFLDLKKNWAEYKRKHGIK